MKPQVKLGDIVMVAHPMVRSNGMVIVPAIVNQIFGAEAVHPTMVNLTAFPPFVTPQHLGSVTLLDQAVSPEFVLSDPNFVGCWGRDAKPAGAVAAANAA